MMNLITFLILLSAPWQQAPPTAHATEPSKTQRAPEAQSPIAGVDPQTHAHIQTIVPGLPSRWDQVEVSLEGQVPPDVLAKYPERFVAAGGECSRNECFMWWLDVRTNVAYLVKTFGGLVPTGRYYPGNFHKGELILIRKNPDKTWGYDHFRINQQKLM